MYFWRGLNIGIGSLRENATHRNIREILLVITGVGSCPVVSKRCTFELAKQQAGNHPPSTELELIRFWTLPFGELAWHLITQVNYGYLASQITVFDPSRDNCRRFIPFLVYALVYPSISINLVTLATLSHWYDSVRTYTCYHFLMNNFLR